MLVGTRGNSPEPVPPDPIRIWRAADGSVLRSYAGNLGPIEGLSWRPHAERDLASVSENGFLRIWNVKSADEMPKHVVRLPRDAAAVAYSPDGKHVAVSAGLDVMIMTAAGE
jgi:WD40 repeat protein